MDETGQKHTEEKSILVTVQSDQIYVKMDDTWTAGEVYVVLAKVLQTIEDTMEPDTPMVHSDYLH